MLLVRFKPYYKWNAFNTKWFDILKEYEWMF